MTTHRILGCSLVAALCVAGTACASGQSDASAPAARRVILVLGDSLAAGFGLKPGEAFPALLQRKIQAQGWQFAVLNAGVSGDTTAGGLRRIDWLLQQRVDVLMVELGGNDGLRGIATEETKANLQAIIDRARRKYPGIQIVLAGMRMPPNLGKDYTARFQAIFPDLANLNQVTLIPFLLEGVGARPDLNQPDMIHPTAAGQRIVAETVWRVLQPLLQTMVTGDARAPVPE